MFTRNNHKIIFIRQVFAWVFSLLIIASTAYAKQCSEPYDKGSLPYPSRQEICPNGTFFIDFFTGKRHPCEEGHVDHVIPTKFMYSIGLCGDDLKKFSQDRDNLKMVHSRTNLEKSSKNPIQYAMRHSDDAELKTKQIVSRMEQKGYPISVEEMTKEASENLKDELRLQYRQKKRAVELLRKRSQLRTITRRKISQRMLKSLARNLGLTATETASPGAGKVIALLAFGAIALDIRDTCENLKDLQDLDDQKDSGEITLEGSSICNMDFKELMATFGVDTELNNCIRARVEKNEVNPPECEDIEITDVNYESVLVEESPKVEEPNYD